MKYGRGKIIIINLVVLISLLIFLELIFGSWLISSNSLNHLGVLRDVNLEIENNLYQDSSKFVTYTRDQYGLRGQSTFNQPAKVDILTVGGSTTDQRFISDGETWQDCLENKFESIGKQYLISNGGVDGQSTFGHLRNFDDWYPLIEGLRPQYIMFYIGINDFYRFSANLKSDRVYRSKLIDKSALYNLYRRLKGAFIASKLNAPHSNIDFKQYTYADETLIDIQVVENYKKHNVPLYKKRIELLIKKVKMMGAQPIFITQPSAFYKITDKDVIGITDTLYIRGKDPFNGKDYFQLMTLLNTAVFDACSGECQVIDLTAIMETRDEDYYDWIHMTPSGASYVCEEIFLQLQDVL